MGVVCAGNGRGEKSLRGISLIGVCVAWLGGAAPVKIRALTGQQANSAGMIHPRATNIILLSFAHDD
jgi:hypothetical protein